MSDDGKRLTSEKALIWRIVHVKNVPWILSHGLHSGNSPIQSPDWVHIGNPELISRRATHPVPVGPMGYLNDYVPFYFTPFSPMMMNICSGRGDVQQRSNDEIVILVSSLHKVSELNLPFVFTDSHACYKWSNFYTDLVDLERIDWPILQARDFKRDPNDLAKFERYQAEALVHEHCPVRALKGLICYTDSIKNQLDTWLRTAQVEMPVYVRPKWYF
jgi:ssDNA thymidine ADP-ribosyltransferase, DarT